MLGINVQLIQQQLSGIFNKDKGTDAGSAAGGGAAGGEGSRRRPRRGLAAASGDYHVLELLWRLPLNGVAGAGGHDVVPTGA
eukprot:365406-Chlamydomonas_euryale.AAC.10